MTDIPPAPIRLSDRAVLRVGGAEARGFLDNLLTQSVEGLAEGEVRYAALLTPQGRLLHDMFVWGEADGVLIDVAASARDDLQRRLFMYRLRAKVAIESADDLDVLATWGAQPRDHAWRPDPRTPLAGWRRVAASHATDGATAYRAHRLALGLCDIAADGLSDKAYATEADLDLLAGVDFKKGCFVGQETTSRMKRRGGVRSRVLPLAVEVEPVAVGAEVKTGTLRAGEVLAVDGPAVLALLRLDRVSNGVLTIGGCLAELRIPSWWPLGEAPRGEAGV